MTGIIKFGTVIFLKDEVGGQNQRFFRWKRCI